jgi:hypothetical protein
MAAQRPLGFSIGPSPEAIEGHPKSIRVERRDIDEHGGRVYLQQVGSWTRDGNAVESYSYHPDGSVSYHDVYDYSAEGKLTEVKTFDGGGALQQTSRYIRLSATEQEKVVTNGKGKGVSRTIIKLDEKGRVIESTSTDLEDGSRIRQANQYDAQGTLIGDEVTFSGMPPGFPSRIETVRQADNRLVATTYAADGTILTRSEVSSGDGAWQASNEIIGGDNPRSLANSERIDERDTEGNWIRKTILADGKPVAEVYRTITYYDH